MKVEIQLEELVELQNRIIHLESEANQAKGLVEALEESVRISNTRIANLKPFAHQNRAYRKVMNKLFEALGLEGIERLRFIYKCGFSLKDSKEIYDDLRGSENESTVP